MKGNKKLLVIAVLLFLVTIAFSTYAIYRSTASAEGTVTAAAWSVKIGTADFDSATYTFTGSDIEWTSNPGKAGTIAPGATGHIDIPVDADGSQVDVLLTAELGNATLPDGMTVALASGSGSQEIQYNPTEGQMKANVRITIEWEGATSDSPAKDGTDKTAAGKPITIPVTLTARQKLPTD